MREEVLRGMMSPTAKTRLKKFLKRESKILLKGMSAKYKIMLKFVLGTIDRAISKAKEEDVEELIRDMISKKQEIYEIIQKAKEGKLDINEYSGEQKDFLMKILPYLPIVLNRKDNPIEKIVNDFYEEFKDYENQN